MANLDFIKYAHWIKGYQSFYEPIVRTWLEEQGYGEPAAGTIKKADLVTAALSLEAGASKSGLPTAALASHVERLRSRSRIQLDLVANNDGLVIGEFKSWGGYQDFPDWKLVEYEFVGEKPGDFLAVQEIAGTPVVEWVLVLWRDSPEIPVIRERLVAMYGVALSIYTLDIIFSTLGPDAQRVRDEGVAALDQAVAQVKTWIGL